MYLLMLSIIFLLLFSNFHPSSMSRVTDQEVKTEFHGNLSRFPEIDRRFLLPGPEDEVSSPCMLLHSLFLDEAPLLYVYVPLYNLE
jgi:hypothetical protein